MNCSCFIPKTSILSLYNEWFVVVGILIWYHNKHHFELSDIVIITRDYCNNVYEFFQTRELAAKIDELKRHGMHASGKHDIVLEFQVHNVLINGRGREHVIDDAIPWSVIPVEASKDYVFHVIHAGADYAYKVAIDGHSITILAMDGFQVKPTVVDAFCVYPGESIECELSANQDAGESLRV